MRRGPLLSPYRTRWGRSSFQNATADGAMICPLFGQYSNGCAAIRSRGSARLQRSGLGSWVGLQHCATRGWQLAETFIEPGDACRLDRSRGRQACCCSHRAAGLGLPRLRPLCRCIARHGERGYTADHLEAAGCGACSMAHAWASAPEEASRSDASRDVSSGNGGRARPPCASSDVGRASMSAELRWGVGAVRCSDARYWPANRAPPALGLSADLVKHGSHTPPAWHIRGRHH
jgi:hypothetical protein